MGLFDWIRCDYPLPGEPLPQSVLDGGGLQTKDLDCGLLQYVITKDGVLNRALNDDETPLTDFTGTVNFYGSNIVAYGPGTYTRDGEDAVSVEYRGGL